MLISAKLDEWERFYIFHRPQGAHNGKTPYEAPEKSYNLQKGSLTINRTLQCWGRRPGIFGIRRMLRPSDLLAVYRIVGPAADTIALASTAVEIVALCAVPRHDEVLPHLYEG
jgi:hypothetical protein